MHGSFVLLLLLLSALLSVVTGQSPCPDPSSISPCVCSYNDFFDTVSVDCSLATSSEDLFAAFNDAVWPITELLDFRLTGNGYVQDLPSGVFGNVSFQSMFIHFTVVSSVHPEALSSSKDRLGELRIFDGSLQEFPWDALPAFTRLETLNLYRNELASVPAVESPSLRSLYLSGNRIAALEGPWSIPNLIFLELDGNPVSELPQGLFQGFENLFSFACSSCNLGPILKTGSMEFRSQDLGSVYLDGNGISSLEPYAITGINPDTHIGLKYNEISELTEASFRPILEILSLGTVGTGYINLFENPVSCDCTMAWIVLNPDFLRGIYGQCQNGTWFYELDPDFFQELCMDSDAMRFHDLHYSRLGIEGLD